MNQAKIHIVKGEVCFALAIAFRPTEANILALSEGVAFPTPFTKLLGSIKVILLIKAAWNT